MSKYVTIILVIFICSCSPTTVFVNEEYSDKEFDERQLIVLPIILDSVSILNIDDVVDDYKVDSSIAVQTISDSLQSSFRKVLNTYIKNITPSTEKIESRIFDNITDSNYYFNFDKLIGEGENAQLVNFKLPQKDFLERKQIIPDIVVVIEEVSFSRNTQEQGGSFIPSQTISTPGGSFSTPGSAGGGGGGKSLRSITKFIIWDYKLNNVIKCGIEITHANFIFAMDDFTWRTNFEKILKNILSDTPFLRKRPKR